MQFQIPQFIETEDKIVGPLTIKQFLWLAAGGGLCFMLFFILQFAFWIIVAIFIMVIAVAGAFGKYNSQTLPVVAWHWLNYTWKPRVYIWQRESAYREVELKGKNFEIPLEMPNIKKLWQSLMTSKTPIAKREKIIRMPMAKDEKFNVFRKITADKEAARRVDYR